MVFQKLHFSFRKIRLPWKFPEASSLQGARSTDAERILIREAVSTTATPQGTASVNTAGREAAGSSAEGSPEGASRAGASELQFTRRSKGFTLFEVLIALAVFALAVTGLAIALESIVQSALEARQRSFCRMELESRLAYDMVDPPIEGDRTLSAAENHGFEITESATQENLEDGEGHPLKAIYRLKITAKNGNSTDSLETLIYHP